MSDVEVDDVFGVHSLNADCKRLRRMKSEGNKATSIGRRRKTTASQDTSVDLELDQATVTCIKPTNKTQPTD